MYIYNVICIYIYRMHLNASMSLRNDTWLGGPRAVGKTAEEAKKVYEDVMALEARLGRIRVSEIVFNWIV